MTPRTVHAASFSGIALKLAGALLAIYLVYDAQLHSESEQLQTARLKLELDDKQRMAASHDAFATRLQEMRGLLAGVAQRLPPKFDSPAIEKTLRDQAALAGIEIASFRSGKERPREFFADLAVDVVVQGSTAGFLKFMDVLLRESPLRQVTAMKIEVADKAASLRATMTVAYYRYMED